MIRQKQKRLTEKPATAERIAIEDRWQGVVTSRIKYAAGIQHRLPEEAPNPKPNSHRLHK